MGVVAVFRWRSRASGELARRGSSRAVGDMLLLCEQIRPWSRSPDGQGRPNLTASPARLRACVGSELFGVRTWWRTTHVPWAGQSLVGYPIIVSVASHA